ncbi:uncharacterized protein T551_00842 [Pneumocystis jirovecii RU7]|uniref:Uncharacterized protein n=1 Tax=Pneumocystis jirovecii (strain RU7) TaxID=1408657 RepID=A0A0W4ZUZ9_PNEJ7|nr:uncharacterized protein T551_00842 [Pneumocystis jirovecii RU7]KTW32160.1 hypothetical protein T551_00842 [Pneumocystis jirovecii RU7]
MVILMFMPLCLFNKNYEDKVGWGAFLYLFENVLCVDLKHTKKVVAHNLRYKITFLSQNIQTTINSRNLIGSWISLL